MYLQAAADPLLPDGSQLVADLRQLVDARSQFFAVRLQIVSGKRLVGQPWPSAVVSQPLRMLQDSVGASLYALGEADMLLLCNNQAIDLVDEAINRALRLFDAPSPLSAGAPPTAKVSWYDLMRDEDFEAVTSAAEAGRLTKNRRLVQDVLRPITAADLPHILERMDRLPIARMIRSKDVLKIHTSGDLTPHFQQLYISIGEFQRSFAPGIDVNADHDLFRYLSATFDKKLLSYVVDQGNKYRSGISFCINIDSSSITQPIFSRFEKVFAERQDVLLEIPLDGILDDLDGYYNLRKRLRRHSIGLVLGGVQLPSLLNLELAALDVDLIKVPCPAATQFEASADAAEALQRRLDRIGCDRVVLTGIETEARLKWAIGLGISRFQGRLVDKLLSALTMHKSARSRTTT